MVFIVGWVAWGYTPQETNRVLEVALTRAAYYMDIDTDEARLAHANDNVHFNSWSGFLGGDEEGGWTLEEKRQAFDWYLSSLGRRNFKKPKELLDAEGCLDAAITECRLLCYTNAVGGLMALVANANCPSREQAIEVVLSLSGVDDGTTSFVAGVVTNQIAYSLRERCWAYGGYAKKVGAGLGLDQARSRAAAFLHRFRQMDSRISYGYDRAMTVAIPEYGSSSNRFEYANWVLGIQGERRLQGEVRDHFINVTNQLLSSGQPLRQLNFGEAGE